MYLSPGWAPWPLEAQGDKQWPTQRFWRPPRVGQRNPQQSRPPRLSETKAHRSEPRHSHKGPPSTQLCTRSPSEQKEPPGSPSLYSSAVLVKDAQRTERLGSGRKRLPKQQLICKPCQLHLQSRFLMFTLVFFSLDYCLQLGFLYCYIPPTINLFFTENRTDQVTLLPNALWKLLTTLLIKSNLLPWPSTPYNPLRRAYEACVIWSLLASPTSSLPSDSECHHIV